MNSARVVLWQEFRPMFCALHGPKSSKIVRHVNCVLFFIYTSYFHLQAPILQHRLDY